MNNTSNVILLFIAETIKKLFDQKTFNYFITGIVIVIVISLVLLIVLFKYERKAPRIVKPRETIAPKPQEKIEIDKSQLIGKLGEEYIIELLGQTIPGQRYLVNNLIVQDQYGNTSQIDHVFINSNGVFVIETKNLSGTIYGTENQKTWTQVFNYGKQKYHLYNPIMQNATHIRRLKEATGTELPIKSIVVFANNNIDKINSRNVYTIEGMICEINAYFEERISPAEMAAFYNQLCEIKTNQISDEEHIDHVQNVRGAI